LARGIDDVPVDARFIRLGKYGIHGNTRLFRDFTKGARVYRTAGRVTSPDSALKARCPNTL
jgi:hypothetical protein